MANKVIDPAPIIKKLADRCLAAKCLECSVLGELIDALRAAPAVDAVEVVHSWWEKSTEGYRICHHCKADVAIFSGHKNYCPNCGAKMDGGKDDGESV